MKLVKVLNGIAKSIVAVVNRITLITIVFEVTVVIVEL